MFIVWKQTDIQNFSAHITPFFTRLCVFIKKFFTFCFFVEYFESAKICIDTTR